MAVRQPLNGSISQATHEVANVLVAGGCLAVRALEHDMPEVPLQPLADNLDGDTGLNPAVLRLRFPEGGRNVSADFLVKGGSHGNS